MTTLRTVKLSEVVLPAKHRELRGVAELAASIEAIGLLNPIALTPGLALIFGRHRLEACRSLGWTELPALILDLDEVDRQLAEIDENLVRNELTVLERCDSMERRKGLYLAKHPETKRGGAPGKAGGGKVAKTAESAVFAPAFVDDTAVKTGKAVRTVRQEVQIATSLAADVKADLLDLPTANVKTDLLKLARMPEEQQRQVTAKLKDGAGSVTEAVRQVKRETVRDVEPLPSDRFRVIYADPPWQYSDNRAGLKAGYVPAENHYPTMSVSELAALDVGALAEADAVLFLWATFPLLPDALAVAAAWGFKYKTSFVWSKVRANFGHYHTADAELLLVCTRGSCLPDADKRERQVQEVERTGRHSEKPEHFRALVDRQYPHGRRVELFRRGAAPEGWAVWGNEAVSAAP